MSAKAPSRIRAASMSRRWRRIRAPTSMSIRPSSATAGISSSRTRRAGPTSWRGCARSASKSRPIIRSSAPSSNRSRRALETVPEYFKLQSFRVLDERRWNARGDLVTLSEATIKVDVAGRNEMTVAEGNGPVNALDAALRAALVIAFPELSDIRLTDYKVRILTPQDGTKAVTRVMIETTDKDGEVWSTVGVSTNVIDASYNALHDSLTYKLWRAGRRA